MCKNVKRARVTPRLCAWWIPIAVGPLLHAWERKHTEKKGWKKVEKKKREERESCFKLVIRQSTQRRKQCRASPTLVLFTDLHTNAWTNTTKKSGVVLFSGLVHVLRSKKGGLPRQEEETTCVSTCYNMEASSVRCKSDTMLHGGSIANKQSSHALCPHTRTHRLWASGANRRSRCSASKKKRSARSRSHHKQRLWCNTSSSLSYDAYWTHAVNFFFLFFFF